jgi:hypothetical protein
MTEDNPSETSSMREERLARRDWILLPLISLLTVCLLAGSVEWIGRRMFPSSDTGGENCMVFNDPSTGARGIPNCVCWEKIPEGQLTQYRFNGSGYRDNRELGPKTPGSYRIVMLGTSMAAGFRVAQDQSFAALLPEELSRRTGRRIELYNESLPWRSPHTIAVHFDDALAARPDMILWILTPIDIGMTSWVLPTHEDDGSLTFVAKAWHKTRAAFAKGSLAAATAEIFRHTRTATLLSDLLYKSRSQYVKSSLMSGDYEKDFLKAESSVEWQTQLKTFDNDAANMEERAKNAGITFVAVLLPDRTQAAMVSMMGEWPKGYDPFKLDNELRSIIVRHGGSYVDVLPDFVTIPNPHWGFFPIDGHPNAEGHATITRLLANALTDGAVPALRAGTQPQAKLEQTK